MDLLPPDLISLTLTYLKKHLVSLEEFCICRLVSNHWNLHVSALVTKLPLKYWYWFARKSLEDASLFVPISYINLKVMMLFERHHLALLIQHIIHFQKLRMIDLEHCSNLYDYDKQQLAKYQVKYNIPLLLNPLLLNGVYHKRHLIDYNGIIIYETTSNIYPKVFQRYSHDYCSAGDSAGAIQYFLKRYLEDSKVIPDIVKITFNQMAYNIILQILPQLLDMYPNVGKIKIIHLNVFEEYVIKFREILKQYPQLYYIKNGYQTLYLNKTILTSPACTVGFGELIKAHRVTILNINGFDKRAISRKNRIGDIYEFIRKNSLMTNTKWLDHIHSIRINVLPGDSCTDFIHYQILRCMRGTFALDLTSLADNKDDEIIINEYLRNCTDFRITKLIIILMGVKRVLQYHYLNILANHPNVIYHNPILRKISLPGKVSCSTNTNEWIAVTSPTLLEYYDLHQSPEGVTLKKKVRKES